MHPRRFSRRLGGRGIPLDSPWPRNGLSAVTRGGGIDYGEGGRVSSRRAGGKGPRTTVRHFHAPTSVGVWGGRGILQDGPWLRNGHSAVAGGGGIDDGGHGISSLCLGETGRGLVCGPFMDPRRLSWRLVCRGIWTSAVTGGGGIKYGAGGGGGVSSRRTGGKGPRSTVRPHHGPTSVLAAIGRQGHPSGLPLASEWPVRRHWGRRFLLEGRWPRNVQCAVAGGGGIIEGRGRGVVAAYRWKGGHGLL